MGRLIISILAIVVLAGVGLAAWRRRALFPPVSSEVIRLTPEMREHLHRLRAEAKFLPDHDYTGVATPEEGAIASAAVDGVIDQVFSTRGDMIEAMAVSAWIGKAMGKVNLLETEDRERTGGYLIEVWYILGFKGSTGRFARGSAYTVPKGYGEPLPPGWTAPDHPRRIG